jgi:hypothetical protein
VVPKSQHTCDGHFCRLLLFFLPEHALVMQPCCIEPICVKAGYAQRGSIKGG